MLGALSHEHIALAGRLGSGPALGPNACFHDASQVPLSGMEN